MGPVHHVPTDRQIDKQHKTLQQNTCIVLFETDNKNLINDMKLKT